MNNNLTKNLKPVYGYELYYKFDPKDPRRIYSIRRKRFVTIQDNTDDHSFYHMSIGGKYKNVYIHNIVWLYYHKKQVPEGYVVHHLDFLVNGSRNNTRSNLILLPITIHRKFHNYVMNYRKTNKRYKNSISLEELVKRINNFEISKDMKVKLILSIVN